MLGLMQQHPLLLSSIITHAARHHGRTEVVSALADGGTHRIGMPRSNGARGNSPGRCGGSAWSRATGSPPWPGTTTGISSSTTPSPAWARSATR
ncbi:hypothetical protein [Roseicella sp. DB1501]|uniref:hypothetical protein n=1 Tax=Roseicella sp. DB1501 TaxID=2730925 RepID=UPI0034A05C18